MEDEIAWELKWVAGHELNHLSRTALRRNTHAREIHRDLKNLSVKNISISLRPFIGGCQQFIIYICILDLQVIIQRKRSYKKPPLVLALVVGEAVNQLLQWCQLFLVHQRKFLNEKYKMLDIVLITC